MSRSADERRRAMPSARAIHEHWTVERASEAAEWFDQDAPNLPTCYACGRYGGEGRTAFKGYDRAHLIDHALGGTSDPANLVLLCAACNQSMPVFAPSNEADAIDWIRYHFHWATIGMARAHDVVRYVLDRGDLPPWFRRGMATLSPSAQDSIDRALAAFLTSNEVTP